MTRTMKDSGVEWIGQIPEDWEFHKLKYHIHIKSGDMLTKSDLTDDGIFPVYGGGEMIGYANKSNTKCNQILIGRVGARCGCVTLPEKDCWATDNALVITSLLPIKLLYYSLVAADLNNINISNAQPLITGNKVKNIIIPFPPLPEQQAIADYLDDKCAQIDNITATINEQIEVLKQYKKSVITEAVTKGLDPNVPMKGSGVEWIGQISEKWNIERFKYNFTFSKGLQITKADLREEGCPVISYGQIHSKINNGVSVNLKLIRFVDGSYQEEKSAITQYGDIIWADTSEDYDGIGNSIFIDSNKNIFAGYHTIITRPLLDKITKYFAYLFQTDIWRLQLRKQATGIKVFSITQKMLKNCSILIPPLCEQQAIADYLDDKCAQIDAVIADKQTQLETLAAYKKSLIYEYVTGKKSVPGFEEA